MMHPLCPVPHPHALRGVTWQVGPADYVAPTPVPNFRAAWEALPEEAEMADDYGLGQVRCCRPGVAMAPCLRMTQPAAVASYFQKCHHCNSNAAQPCKWALANPASAQLIFSQHGRCGHNSRYAVQRAGLEEAVEAVLTTLGMAPCEGTDAVPPNARHAPSSLSTMQLIAGRRLKDAVGVDARKMPSPFLCTTRGRKDIVSSTAGSTLYTSGGCVGVVAEVHMAYYAEP